MRDIIGTLALRGEYTPDFNVIKLQKYHLVFIYHKRLMKGGVDNAILLPSESKYLGKSYSCTDRYILRGTEYNTFNAAFTSDAAGSPMSKMGRSHLKGEVYALSIRALLNVDRFLENTHMFEREPRNVFLQDQDFPIKSTGGVMKPSVRALTYMGREEYWSHYKMDKSPSCNDSVIGKWCWMS